MSSSKPSKLSGVILLLSFVVAIVAGVGVSMLLVDIQNKQQDARQYPLMLNKVSDDNVSLLEWGKNFPFELNSYLKTADSTQPTDFGGSLPYSKLIRYPQLTKLWAGYAFAFDFNEERGHYYAQVDQLETKRNDKAWLNEHGLKKFNGQPGACMNCHSGWTPSLIRELGWETFNHTPYVELAAKLKSAHGESMLDGGKLGGTCADCHSPDDMSLRVTRPAYINAMLKRGYEPDPKSGIKATRREMRSHVCQQCHVEYYFNGPDKVLTFPWSNWPKDKPLRIEMIEEYYDTLAKIPNGFKSDWTHKDTGAPMLKMQHPETELFSSGIHARSGVACADCHMPYERDGAVKRTSHHITSPLANINGSCQTCHAIPEQQIRERVKFIQTSNQAALHEAEGAISALIDDIKAAQENIKSSAQFKLQTTPEAQEAYLDSILHAARDAQRRASMRWDFISSENSTGFHSPQEAMRVLAQATDWARRGQLMLAESLKKVNLGVSLTTGSGIIPPPGAPIPESKAPVGQPPPLALTQLDQQGL